MKTLDRNELFFRSLGEAAQTVGSVTFYPSLLHVISLLVPSHRQVVMRYSRYWRT